MSALRTIYWPKIVAHIAMGCVCIFLFLLSLPTASPTFAQDFDDAQSDDIPNELIFRVILPPQWLISEAIFAYEKQGTYYLPVIELAEEFDFLVETEENNQVVSGFAISEENTYSIDIPRNELTIRGVRETISDNAFLKSDFLATDDLYISLEVINKIWPVKFDIDLPTLTVISSLEGDGNLAFIERQKRLQNQIIVMSRLEQRKERQKLLPRRDNPYSIFGKPVVDIQGIYTYDDDEDELTGQNIFTGVQQVGKFLTEFSANIELDEDGDFKRPESIRFKASRKSAGEEYLVPHVRRVEFGDVNIRTRELISNTETGRGVVISNDNRERGNSFDEITLEGTGPPGWEIEVYRNEELINIGVVPDDGQFFFEDVVLNFGNNQIKILLFGPQGQVREQVENFSAGGNMLSPGQVTYEAGFLDSEREFILLEDTPRTSPRGLVKSLQTGYGLNRFVTVFGNYTETPDIDKSREYISAGAIVNSPIGIFETEAYNELGGGNALSLGLVTQFKGIRSNFDLDFFNGFESEDAGFGGNRKTFEAETQLNSRVNIANIPIGLRLSAVHTQREEVSSLTTINTAQTFTRGPVRISHNTATTLNSEEHITTTAGFSTTVRSDPWQLRGNLNYNVHPVIDLSTVNAELRYDPAEVKYQASVNVGHNFTNDVYNLGLQAGYDFDTVLATGEANYMRNDGWEFVLRATSSLSPYTKTGDYGFSSAQQRNAAPVRAQVFLDNDADGVFTEADEPIEGARIMVGNSISRTGTDEDGLLITNSAADRIRNVRLDKTSLEDPYFIPSTEGFSTVMARGGVVEAVFPIIESGAIEGTVYRQFTDKLVTGLQLELVNADGEAVDSVVTAFDGFYAFEFVPPGTYTVRAESSQGVSLLDNEASVINEELFVFGHDLYLEETGDTPPAVPVPAVENGEETFGPYLEGTQTDEELYGPFLEDIKAAAGEEIPIEEAATIEPLQAVPPAINTDTNITASPTADAAPIGLYSLIQR